MCNAMNHRVGCTCGWGGEGHLGRGGGPSYSYNAQPRWQPQATWRGWTRDDGPNAICPVCGASVYFVRPQNGGSIWLDVKGPPWPKHPCMDSAPRRIRYPAPLRVPAAPGSRTDTPGWAVHQMDLQVSFDGAWSCSALVIAGTQVATARKPPPALTPAYLRWSGPERLYGEVQYLAAGAAGVTTITLHVCSYGVMRRARQVRQTAPIEADWQMLQWWIEDLHELDTDDIPRLLRALKQGFDAWLVPGWANSAEKVNFIRSSIRQICRQWPQVNPDTLFKWMRLLLG